MNVADDAAVADIAAAIGEPARATMLFCLMDGHARTSTELSVAAEITASTASAHLHRLRAAKLVVVVAQGKHRYYSIAGGQVAAVLEGLNVLAGRGAMAFVPRTPHRLRAARTCYDHVAGAAGVSIHDRLRALGWLRPGPSGGDDAYEMTSDGCAAFTALGVDVESVRAQRRRFAYACLDWSERRPHLGGAVGAMLLKLCLQRKWFRQDADSRSLTVTGLGRRELAARFGVQV